MYVLELGTLLVSHSTCMYGFGSHSAAKGAVECKAWFLVRVKEAWLSVFVGVLGKV